MKSKQHLNEKLKNKDKSKDKDNKLNITDQSIKNIFTKNNLSFVTSEKDSKNKDKIDFLALNKAAIKNNNCRTSFLNHKCPTRSPPRISSKEINLKSNISDSKINLLERERNFNNITSSKKPSN